MNSNWKSVAIITLPGNYNYGNRLQAYATTIIYRNLGFEPVLLNPTMPPSFRRIMKLVALSLLGRKVVSPENFISEQRKASFEQFDRHLVSYDIDSYKNTTLFKFSIFSVGSDQVWNPQLMCDRDKWYFLSFVPQSKRVALSPSIGVDKLKLSDSRRIAKGVRNFNSLSVREQRGAELIKDCSGRTARVICDPTLVLAPNKWRSVSDARFTPDKPFVFVYLLGDSYRDITNVLRMVSGFGAKQLIRLSDRDKPGEIPAGPADFISLIDNASHVVTDSYHAAVFASILQTPLTIMRREGGASMFSRLDSLTRTLGIEHKVYGSHGFDLSRAGDYLGVPEAIECERKIFMDYLESCLDAQLPEWRGGHSV